MSDGRAMTTDADPSARRAEGLGAHLVARSPAMREVRDLLAQIAPTEIAVLLRGELGVGKGAVARAIHAQSRRAGGPFVHVDCDAILEEELADRLLGRSHRDVEGHEAVCEGLLESAQGGTLFLDHVEHLPHWAQVRLFDAFQEELLYRSATLGPLPLDVRVIASTTCDLERAAAEGSFYELLYHFLIAVVIQIPPLRERQQDVTILAEQCLTRFLARLGYPARRPSGFTDEARERLLSHDWPGNLPELASVVARAVMLAGGKQIGKEAIVCGRRKTRRLAPDTISVPLVGNLREIERQIIRETVQRCRGNKAAAARLLGLHRRTLYRLLEER